MSAGIYPRSPASTSASAPLRNAQAPHRKPPRVKSQGGSTSAHRRVADFQARSRMAACSSESGPRSQTSTCSSPPATKSLHQACDGRACTRGKAPRGRSGRRHRPTVAVTDRPTSTEGRDRALRVPVVPLGRGARAGLVSWRDPALPVPFALESVLSAAVLARSSKRGAPSHCCYSHLSLIHICHCSTFVVDHIRHCS